MHRWPRTPWGTTRGHYACVHAVLGRLKIADLGITIPAKNITCNPFFLRNQLAITVTVGVTARNYFPITVTAAVAARNYFPIPVTVAVAARKDRK